jgi:CheY-like chemotaxis protein
MAYVTTYTDAEDCPMSHAKIMVVEDEPVAAAILERILARSGYSIAGVVASGQEAIDRATLAKPDLVLMDVHLEGPIDGIEAAKQIRTRFGIPIIYLTGYADANSVQRAMATEPEGYLLKPVRKEELVANIEMALCKSESHSHEQREHEFGDILNALDEGIITFDNEDHVRVMNHRAETALAVSHTRAWKMSASEVVKHLIHGSSIAIVRDIPIKNKTGKIVGRMLVFAVRDSAPVEHIDPVDSYQSY